MKKNISKIFNRQKLIQNRLFSSQLSNIPSVINKESITNLCDNLQFIKKVYDGQAAYIGPESYYFLKNAPESINLSQTLIDFKPNYLYLCDINQILLKHQVEQITNCSFLKQKYQSINLKSITDDHQFSKGLSIIPICCDEELWPFQPEQLNLIISSMHLHWVNEVEVALARYLESLNSDGTLIGSIFGSDTLEELRICFTLAENERYGGVSQHTSPLISITEMGNLISRLNYQMTTICTEKKNFQFDSVYHLMQFLQESGNSEALISTRKGVFKDTLFAMSCIYETMFRSLNNKKIDSTFEFIYFTGWKYHDDQQKPKERGSFSLYDFKEQVAKYDPEGASKIIFGSLEEEEEQEVNQKKKK